MGGHDTPEAIKKETRTYLLVFAALAVLTVITVAVSYLDMNHTQAVFIGVLVATVKASLVAAFFMHLLSEEKLIYGILALTMFFFAVMFFYLTAAHLGDVGEPYVMEGAVAPAEEHH